MMFEKPKSDALGACLACGWLSEHHSPQEAAWCRQRLMPHPDKKERP